MFKIDFGLYSDKNINSKLEIISKKYKNYIFNSDSAFFYHGLTDNIPSKYYIAANEDHKKLKMKILSRHLWMINILKLEIHLYFITI